MVEGFAGRIRVSSPVTSIRRYPDRIGVQCQGSPGGEFEHVIFACHSDQALRILGAEATVAERDVLGAMPFEENEAVLHTDTSLLPRTRRAWASWNYRVRGDRTQKVSVTYNMSLLQGISGSRTFCVTLNDRARIAPEAILATMRYAHPRYSHDRTLAAGRYHEISHQQRTSYCGAYWGNGFHEDGVVSAMRVCAPLMGPARSFDGAAPPECTGSSPPAFRPVRATR
jgi:predicted NAD/FAD-binding protein